MKYLRKITESDALAARELQATDPATLAALIRQVALAARTGEYPDDTASLAAITAPRILAGRTDRDVARAARIAVAMARRDVTRSYALAGWDLTGDMTEVESLADPDARSTWQAPRAPRADSGTDASPRDYLATIGPALTRMGRTDLAEHWQALLTDYLGHGEGCPDCADTGRKVTPQGMRAHVAGLSGTDSAYARTRRESLAALRGAAPILAALLDTYAPRHAGSSRQGRTVMPVTPVTRKHGTREGRTVTYPARQVECQVSDPAPLTPAQTDALADALAELFRAENRAMALAPMARHHGPWREVTRVDTYRVPVDSQGYPAHLGYGVPWERYAGHLAALAALRATRARVHALAPQVTTRTVVRDVPALTLARPGIGRTDLVNGRPLTPRETWAARFPQCRDMAAHAHPDTPDAWEPCDCQVTRRALDSDPGGSSAPAPARQRRQCACRGACPEEGHALADLAVLTLAVPAPRKRKGGSGATGPTVPSAGRR